MGLGDVITVRAPELGGGEVDVGGGELVLLCIFGGSDSCSFRRFSHHILLPTRPIKEKNILRYPPFKVTLTGDKNANKWFYGRM